jgi:hypothetical protein
MVNISSASIYQIIHDAHLEVKLEKLLLKLLEYNSTPNVQEPIRQFLINYQVMSDNFFERYNRANTFEEVLESYYQFSKNQCVIIDTLLETLKMTLDKDHTREDLAMMLKESFTF